MVNNLVPNRRSKVEIAFFEIANLSVFGLRLFVAAQLQMAFPQTAKYHNFRYKLGFSSVFVLSRVERGVRCE